MAEKRKLKIEKADQEFYDCIGDIIAHPVVQQMKQYPHHCGTSCFRHCLNVSYYNYQICRLLGLDARSAARAGMLHDLFLYDWRKHALISGQHFHGLTHPRQAVHNAEKYFQLNELEKEIILKHMWPLTVVPPVRREAFVICLTDKYCGACEITDFYSKRLIPADLRLPFGYRAMYQLALPLLRRLKLPGSLKYSRSDTVRETDYRGKAGGL